MSLPDTIVLNNFHGEYIQIGSEWFRFTRQLLSATTDISPFTEEHDVLTTTGCGEVVSSTSSSSNSSNSSSSNSSSSSSNSSSSNSSSSSSNSSVSSLSSSISSSSSSSN